LVTKVQFKQQKYAQTAFNSTFARKIMDPRLKAFERLLNIMDDLREKFLM